MPNPTALTCPQCGKVAEPEAFNVEGTQCLECGVREMPGRAEPLPCPFCGYDGCGTAGKEDSGGVR